MKNSLGSWKKLPIHKPRHSWRTCSSLRSVVRAVWLDVSNPRGSRVCWWHFFNTVDWHANWDTGFLCTYYTQIRKNCLGMCESKTALAEDTTRGYRKILWETSKTYNGITTLEFRRADFSLFIDLPGTVPWETGLQGKVAEKSSLAFKNSLFRCDWSTNP